jgi:pyruvate/2-oxoglutarate dehydrogenase complex dihydrolipoamide dehydrogenase (E3) component/glycerol uptake facilitator-like aquaporin
MGLAVGATVIALVTSPWGKQSGGHFNPALTLAFYRLGKIRSSDAFFYVVAQFSGAIAGVCIARYLLPATIGHDAIRYAVTAPGAHGSASAFIGELTISLVLMSTVLFASSRERLIRYTPYLVGFLYATFMVLEAPLSGMSMNPARSFAPALYVSYWHALWLYFIAPTVGMLVAAEIFLHVRGGVPPFCAKLHHTNNKRCIFRHETNLPEGKDQMQNTQMISPAKSIRKTDPEDYDLVILGGGTGSTVAAWTFASEGKRVAVIDRKYIGGSCPNIACLPSKNIIHSAKVASYFRRSKEFGIAHDGFTVDMRGVRERKRKMVSGLNAMYLENYQNTGAEFILGAGRFIAPRTVEVSFPDGTTRQLRGTNVIVGTGTRPTVEPIPGLAEAQPLTHVEALELDRVPEHLLVLGGGYVGMELSQAMRRFGSKVTVIDRNQRLMQKEDQDVCEALRKLFEDEDIDIHLNVRMKRVSGKSGQSVSIVVSQNGADAVIEGSHVLVALGRTPNTEGLGLELAGVELTDRGYIKVNERLQTTAPGVWAIGEVAGSPQFTHISVDDFRVVHANITGGNRVTTGRQVPYCLFTDPELAHIGLSEIEAKAQGISYRLFKVPMETNLRARTLSETRGFLKALVEAESDRILGFTALGTSAGEIMAAIQVAMIGNLPYTALRDAVLTHPTLVEGLTHLFSSMPSADYVADETSTTAA